MRRSWFAVIVVIIGLVAVAFAQNKSDTADGSLTALTAELRLLRLAVEEQGRTQTQTQALSAYLMAQQGRIQQTASRLDAARDELQSASDMIRDAKGRLESLDQELAKAAADSERLENLREVRKHFLDLQASTVAREERASAKVTELSNALAYEEGRWADVVARLEQLGKK
jgi:septal ring factor EnvC (AmiA/AmiB activator)